MIMDCNTAGMCTSKGEGKRLLRTLELKAFRGVVDALRAQGSFTTQKCRVLKNLASTLKVGDERCRSEMRRAVNDNLLNYIALCSDEQNSEENWRLESARKVARVPMINEPTVFTALADKVSNWVVSHNRTLAEHDSTLTEILESKKCRTDANASRYYETKLFDPLLPTLSRNSEGIAIELEKIKLDSKRSSNNIHFLDMECLSATKPNDVPLQVENPQTADTLVENTRVKMHSDEESDHNDVTANSFEHKDALEVKNNIPNKSSLAKGRTKPWQKRSQLLKSSSLQEELSRTVSAVNALVSPAFEQRSVGKQQSDNSPSTATADADCQPKEKKMKLDTSRKVPPVVNFGKNKSSGVSVDEKKSLLVHDSLEKSSSICNVHPIDDQMMDGSQETVPQSLKSSGKFAQENPGLPLEKDFTPHTFNLIPASRRLKMVKKKESSNESPIVKEQDLVPADNREMQKLSSLTIIDSNLLEKNRSPSQNSASDKTQVNNSSSSAVVNRGRVTSNEPQSERRKETDEKLKNVLPMLSQTKKTLSLLGNIKVRNLNAKDESLEDSLLSYEDKDNYEMVVENEEEIGESELDQSDIDSSSIVDSSEYSTFDDSDSHSVIEYWDHDDDEDIFEGGSYSDSNKGNFENGNTFIEKKVSDDDIHRRCQGVPSDQISTNSEYSDEIVEEIVEDEEFYSSDNAESYGSDDAAEKSVFYKKAFVNSSLRNGEENVEKVKQTVSTEKPMILKLEPKVTASNASITKASVISSNTLIQNSSACKVSNNQKSCVKMETSPATRIEPLASGTAVSILKLRKPVVVGTTGTLAKGKEVVLVSPKLQKTVAVNVKNEKSPSVLSKCQMITPSKCIVRGQTISLANARLITATPQTKQSTVITSRAAAELPKITLYSSAKISNSSGLNVSTSASKRIILPQSTKVTSASTPFVKHAPFKPSTMSIPKKVCRLYDLIDVSDSSYSNSSSIHNVKKNLPNKKPVVNVSSS